MTSLLLIQINQNYLWFCFAAGIISLLDEEEPQLKVSSYIWEQIMANAICGELKIKKWISVIYGWTATGGHQIVSSLKAKREGLNKWLHIADFLVLSMDQTGTSNAKISVHESSHFSGGNGALLVKIVPETAFWLHKIQSWRTAHIFRKI